MAPFQLAMRTPLRRALAAPIPRLPEGPARRAAAAPLHDRLRGAPGLADARRGTVTGGRPYGLTARTTVEGALRCAAPGYDRKGALAPSQAFDPRDFLGALGEFGVEHEVE